jgi:hypothetical protein
MSTNIEFHQLTADSIKKVLVVARFYAPMQNTRAVQAERVVQALRDNGLDIRVISDGSGGKLNRLVAELGLYLNWVDLAWQGARQSRDEALQGDWRPDCVLSMSTPFDSHLLGNDLAQLFDVPWAAFLSDPWPIWTAPGPYAGSNKGLYRRLQFRCGERLLGQCDALLAPTLEQLELQREVYPILADTPGVETLHCASAENPSTPGNATAGIFHIGQITPERCGEALINGIKTMADSLRGDTDVLTFVGDVADGIKQALSDEEQQGIVAFPPPVSSERSQELMRSAKALLLIEADMDASPFLPSKITDYAAAQRPIIIVSNANSAQVRMMRGHTGVYCVPHNADLIAETLVVAHKRPLQPTSNLAAMFAPDVVAARYADGLRLAQGHYGAY